MARWKTVALSMSRDKNTRPIALNEHLNRHIQQMRAERSPSKATSLQPVPVQSAEYKPDRDRKRKHEWLRAEIRHASKDIIDKRIRTCIHDGSRPSIDVWHASLDNFHTPDADDC